ncbi:MAG TPA: hypothetical protein VFS77_13835, partial [Pyrinomonadaceae bacterium]|nr:hypothetical protein [Pyrinomonadaceae bacterium]
FGAEARRAHLGADSLPEDTNLPDEKATTRSCRNASLPHFGSLLFSLQGVPQLLRADSPCSLTSRMCVEHLLGDDRYHASIVI